MGRGAVQRLVAQLAAGSGSSASVHGQPLLATSTALLSARAACLGGAAGGSSRTVLGECGHAALHGSSWRPWAGAWACGGRRCMGTGVSGTADATLGKARKLAVAVGALAGAFGSLVGVGGGVLISPIIANACKSLPQRVISGTSLAAVAATGTAAGLVYWSAGAVDLTSAAVLAASAVAFAPLGARATHAFDCAALRRMMGYWLLAVAPLVPLKPYLVKHYSSAPGVDTVAGPGAEGAPAVAADAAAGAGAGGSAAPSSAPPSSTSPTQAALPPLQAAAAGAAAGEGKPSAGAEAQPTAQPPSRPVGPWRPLQPSDGVLAATGMLAGFASGLLGIGGGTVVTPLLTLATGLPQVSVLGTSLAAMVVPSLVGLAQHARMGNVDVRMAAGLAAGTLVGGMVGGRLGVAAPEGLLEWVFCGGMAFLGRGMLRGAAQARAAAAAAGKAAAGGAGKAAGGVEKAVASGAAAAATGSGGAAAGGAGAASAVGKTV